MVEVVEERKLDVPVEPPPTSAPTAPANGRNRPPLPINWDDPYAFKPLNEGDIISGTVVHIDREGILVDVGMKSEGLIPPDHISNRGGVKAEDVCKVGENVDVYVLDPENQDGNLILSKKRADYEKAWQRIMVAHQNDEVINATVTDRVKGGLVVDVGIRGFVPASHVGSGKVRNLEKFIGETIALKAIEVDRDRKRVVLSNKAAEEEERSKKRTETLATLDEGQVREGEVRRVTDYGAFVDIGGIDGLLHVSEMSWTRIKHPNDVVKVGDKIQVMILKVTEDRKKISLGLRQILPDPWSDVAEQYQEGQIVTGVVTRLVPFGAFVQLKEGVEGIISNSELSERRVNKPDEVLSEGEEVTVKVLDVRPEERRINLSLRQAPQAREATETAEFLQSQREGRRGSTIGDMVDFGDLEGKRPTKSRRQDRPARGRKVVETEEEDDELDALEDDAGMEDSEEE